MIRRMEEADITRVAEIHVFGWRCAYRGFIEVVGAPHRSRYQVYKKP
ncbi:MAG: hypothetical protein FWD90_01500 [Defluviitaleaceae bacterium]|nr:hypothetical protein [Defluviitaleaceae bacterium]